MYYFIIIITIIIIIIINGKEEIGPFIGWSRYQDSNSVPTSHIATDLAIVVLHTASMPYWK